MNEPHYFTVRRFREEMPQKFLQYPLTVDRDGLICSRLASARRILEVGAGLRHFLPELKVRGFAGIFKTMDVDRDVPVDYYSLDDVKEHFDAVLMREVIEHIPRSVFFEYLEKVLSILDSGGILIMTTPNPWAVSWQFADYTHVSFWPPADLYGILRHYGCQPVEIHRVVWPSRFLWLKRLYWALHSRMYDIDFAGSYIVIARKPHPGSES